MNKYSIDSRATVAKNFIKASGENVITSRDVQADKEGFPKIAIEKVGVRNIELPVWVRNRDGDFLSTIANVSSYCDLVEENKGINMSRITRTIFEVFDPENKELVTLLSSKVVKALQFAHETSDVYFKARFKYPFYHLSPETNLPSPGVVNVVIETTLHGKEMKKYLTVEMVGMSLCPCSKDMSLLMNNLNEEESACLNVAVLPTSLRNKLNEAGFGAHNQKSFVEVKVEMKNFFNIDSLIDIIRQSVSAEVFSVLKRPDEKFVTEMSYMGGYIDADKNLIKATQANAGPKFVEDIARQVAETINETYLDKQVIDYSIVVRNQESIHSNDIETVAVLTAGRSLK